MENFEMNRKNILLAVTGMSPQVVTETIYALYNDKKIVIDEVQIITTSVGKEQAWLNLGAINQSDIGQIKQLCNDYDLPQIHFEEDSIFVIPDSSGKEISDARSIDDHNALADFITNHVRNLTKNKEVNIHASLAGGRKTMTFFMGYALSLFGRVQDSLTHVLVSKEFENLPGFFYPTPYDKTLTNRENLTLNARKAQVTLAQIPFVRMRDEMPGRMIKQPISYTETIDLINMSSEEPSLYIDLLTPQLIVNDKIEVPMANAEIAFLAWMAHRTIKSEGGVATPTEGYPELSYANDFSFFYEIITGSISGRVERALKEGMDKKYFEGRKTNIKKALETTLGKKTAANFYVQPTGLITKHGTAKLFGLKIKSENITIRQN